MKRQIVVILSVCLMNLMFVGCGEVEQPTNNRIIEPSNELESISYTFTPCDGESIITVTDASLAMFDDGGSSDIMTTFELPEVQYYVDKFASDGFGFDSRNSFITIGTAITEDLVDTIEAKIAIIILRNTIDSTQSFIQIAHAQSTNHTEFPDMIGASIIGFVLPANDLGKYDMIHLGTDEFGVEQYLWAKDIISPYSPKTDQPIALWSWRSWRACAIGGTVAGCVTSAAACVLSGPAYLICLDLGCGGSMVGSMLGCAVNQWLS